MNAAYEPDPRTVRRMAYRLAGRAFALAIMKVPIKQISLERLWRNQENDRDGEIDMVGYNARPEQVAFAYVLGECVANLSGVPQDIEPQKYGPPDLSPIEHLRGGIVEFGERLIGPISVLAETLLASKRLSEEDLYKIIIRATKQRVV